METHHHALGHVTQVSGQTGARAPLVTVRGPGRQGGGGAALPAVALARIQEVGAGVGGGRGRGGQQRRRV